MSYKNNDLLIKLQKSVISGGIAAGNALVTGDRDGVLFENYEGVYDAEKNDPVDKNTLFHLYSMTKDFTVISALLLYERGLIGLDDPVYKYIPEYKYLTVHDNGVIRRAEKPVTLRHLFTMTSGLTYLYDKTPDELNGLKRILNENKPYGAVGFAKVLASLPLAFEPGERFEYGLSHDVLGAVIETVSGITLDKFIFENITSPLGMSDTRFYQSVQGECLGRLAKNTAYADGKYVNVPLLSRPVPLFDWIDGSHIFSGGSGLVSSARDMAAFLSALTSGKILKPETLALMTAPALTEGQRRYYNYEGGDEATFGYEHTYGFGVRVQDRISAERRGSIGEWGWSGALGTWFFVSPELDQWFLYLHQHSPSEFRKYIIPLRNAFYDRSDKK